MNDKVENIKPRYMSVEDPRHPHDAKDSTVHQTDYERSYVIPAIVTGQSPDYSDEWIVDVYGKGFVLPNGSDGPVTRKGLRGHALHSGDWFEEGEKVNVRIMPDNTVWIIHEEPIRLGVVVEAPEGEEEREDNYYWVALARFKNTTDAVINEIEKFPSAVALSRPNDFDGDLAPITETGPSYNYEVILVENLAEHLSGGHGIALGTPVSLKWGWDRSTPTPRKRWYFESGGTGGLFAASGRFKLMQIIDDLAPGTWGADYLRFKNGVLLP